MSIETLTEMERIRAKIYWLRMEANDLERQLRQMEAAAKTTTSNTVLLQEQKD